MNQRKDSPTQPHTLDSTTPGEAVEAWYAARQSSRSHLGLSEIGHECPRYLWYRHHGVPPVPTDGRMLRVYRMGDMIEAAAVEDLSNAGYYVHSTQRMVSILADGVELRGHIDGIVEEGDAPPRLLEVKSSNAARFAKLLKVGYEAWDAKYKAQIHVYMFGLSLSQALAWVENKNTQAIYTEQIALDPGYATEVMTRAVAAIAGDTPPERGCSAPHSRAARWCGFRFGCWDRGI